MLDYIPNIFIDGLANDADSFRKDSIKTFLLNEKTTGLKLTISDKNGKTYCLVSYGIVNDKAIFLQLMLFKDFEKTDDLPANLQSIITIKN